MTENNTIFVQIASYRDPELLPTIRDLLQNAKYPENLTICICWQHDETENLDEFKDDPRFIIIDVPWQESKGACWARHSIQQYYTCQKYTLQLDSHHRFIKNWDEELIQMYENLKLDGYEKPLITAYLPSYNPSNDPQERSNDVWQINFKEFTNNNVILFIPGTLQNWKLLTKPVPARFYSAHFCFTDGAFSEIIQHDPDYYFHGEEISITVRAFTYGYDLFHPHKVIAWHEYTRSHRTKHWDDHKEWYLIDSKSKLKNTSLFEKQEIHINRKYGFGNVRTVEDYEKYSGVLLTKLMVQDYTLQHKLPPNPTYHTVEEYERSFIKNSTYTLSINKNQLPENDYAFLGIFIETNSGELLYRQDIQPDLIQRIKQNTYDIYNLSISFQSTKIPEKWILWPYSKSKGWTQKYETLLPS